MTDVSTTLPPALSRALDLLIDPPSEPDVSNGYLDLLGTSVDGDDEVAKNDGAKKGKKGKKKKHKKHKKKKGKKKTAALQSI